MITPWTKQEKKDFENWHEQRLLECGYSKNTVEELRRARIKWLGKIKALEKA